MPSMTAYNFGDIILVQFPFTDQSQANQRRAVISRGEHMEHIIQLHIEKLPEGVYLATSDDVQGLVAQGRTIQETIEIARDVAKKLIEANASASLPAVAESFDYQVIIAT
jgi:predicted RNase H-like HicB family nuclease